MEKITIKKLNGDIIHSSKKPDNYEDWLNSNILLNSWGNPGEYTITIEEWVNQPEINQEALDYLASTDWYIIRELDTGTPCPVSVKELRNAARNKIKN